MSGVVCDIVEAWSKVLKTTEKIPKNKACLSCCLRVEIAVFVNVGGRLQPSLQVLVDLFLFGPLVVKDSLDGLANDPGLEPVPRVDDHSSSWGLELSPLPAEAVVGDPQ